MLALKNQLRADNDKLSKNFDIALQDTTFKHLTNGLKLEKNILMKYTSSLQDCCEEYNHCIDCQSISECQNKLLGFMYCPRVIQDKIKFHYVPCRYKQTIDNKNQHLKNIQFYDLPTKLKEARWEDVDKSFAKRKEVLLFLNNFMKEYPNASKGCYISGNFGCGKTYMIVAMFQELAKKNVKSAILFWPEFLRSLKSTFNTDYEYRMEHIKKVPLLLIDDLGAEVTTSWSRDEILCSILQYRMDEGLPTFITSNMTIDALSEHLSITKDGVETIKAKRLIERIKQVTEPFEIIDTNKRK